MPQAHALRLARCALLGLALALSTMPALGQAESTSIPTAAEPRGRDLPSVPQAPETARASAIAVQPTALFMPPNAHTLPVTLGGIRLSGSQIYAEGELAHLYHADLGKRTVLSRVYEIAQAIQDFYRADGYMLTRVVVPKQTVGDDNVFALRVVEGYISATRVEGAVGGQADMLLRLLRTLEGRRPANSADIERVLLLLNDLAGVTARGVLRPAADEPGASELVLRVQRTPFEAATVANNRGSSFTGPGRAMLVGRANSLFNSGESLELLLLSAFDSKEQRLFRLGYEQPFGADGWRFSFDASYGPSEPGARLSNLNMKTRSERYGVGLSYPVTRSRARNLTARVGFDVSRSTVETLGIDFSNDRLRVVYAGFDYDFVDEEGGQVRLELGVRRGMSSFGASADSNPDRSRLDASSNFTSVSFRLDRRQKFVGRLGVGVTARGQFSFDTLLSDEEFLLGGEGIGRGYDPSELAGEHGLALSTEFAFDVGGPESAFSGTQVYSYYDLGAVWNEDDGAGGRASLASSGLGVRTRVFDRFQFAAEVAKPLTRAVSSEGDRDPRLYLQFSAFF